MIVALSPIFNAVQQFDNSGKPLAGGKLFCYEGGSSSVQKDTYTTAAGEILNTNPLVLDSSGRLVTDLWLIAGDTYHLVLTKSDGTTVLTDVDDVIGLEGRAIGGLGASAIWTPSLAPPTYISPTQVALPGNEVQHFQVGNRIRAVLGVDTVAYGTVSAVAFSSPNTTISVEMDGTPLSAGITEIDWSGLEVLGAGVDAGAVKYSSTLGYTTINTVGNKLRALDTALSTGTSALNSIQKVWPTMSFGTYASTNFALSPIPATTSYALTNSWLVKFDTTCISGNLAVSGLASVRLRQFDGAGQKIPPVIVAGLVTRVVYDGADMVILDSLPAATTTSSSDLHGSVAFITNSSWTVPANVSSAKITCVAGGGGGTGGYSTGTDYVQYFVGTDGGFGGCAIKTIPVTPGAVYPITIGGGGAAGVNGGLWGSSAVPGALGGTTTFGSNLIQAIGGGPNKANGTGTGTYGVNASYFVQGGTRGTGGNAGNAQTNQAPTAGSPGCVIIEY